VFHGLFYSSFVSALCWLKYGDKKPLFIYEQNSGHVCNYEESEHFVSRLWNMKLKWI